jgi:two-component system nitrate/nitrite response regulator NarL
MLDRTNDWPGEIGEVTSQALTPREAEVCQLVTEGLANKAIARQLGLCEGTVKIHLHHIYRKLRVANRVGLILASRAR